MKDVSLSTVSLCLFTIFSFLSLDRHFGPAFSGLPFKMALLTLALHIVISIKDGRLPLRLELPSMLLGVVLCASAAFTYWKTIDPSRSLEIWEDFSKCIILFFLIANIIRTRKEFVLYIWTLVLVGAYIGYDYSHNPFWQQGRAYYYGSNLVGDPNGISILLTYTLSFIAALFLTHKNKMVKLALVLAIFYCILGIIEGRSRGAFIGIVAMGIATIFAIPAKKKVTGIVVLSLALIVVVIRYVPLDYIYRVQEIISPESDSTGSAQTRFETMAIAGKYIIKHPFSEFGLGNHSYYIAEQYGYNPAIGDDIFKGSFLAHNIFLQFGADTGLLPLIIFVLFVYSIFRLLFRYLKKISMADNIDSRFTIYIKCTLISLTSFFAGAFFLPWSYRIFTFIICGVAVALCHVIKERYAL